MTTIMTEHIRVRCSIKACVRHGRRWFDCFISMTFITACPDCGSRRFTATESTSHRGYINDRGTLLYKSTPQYAENDGIVCDDCGRLFASSDFADLDFA